MKRYGIRIYKSLSVGYTYQAEKEWVDCVDVDNKFGTDDINAAYQYNELYTGLCAPDTEVFDKGQSL